MNSQNRRWLLIGSLLVVGGALLTLVFTSFTGALVYFYTPSEIKAKGNELQGRKVRIGGMVQEGSLLREPGSQKMRFMVVDNSERLPVQYEGMTPDLFREGQGVIVEGVWRSGETFQAATILAKHSEDYVPVKMSEEGIAKARESMLKSLR
ncbi:cytochrome c maturation protein CcmE [Candidatus Magnetaquicoccus inordinatus]|uniref:cytochrome c maturation protein CcmE n=1 Tax=Candidatus Magnetaquicoccus inordinatus TaxID=2496818 RepID=UPI00102C3E85|nr:cytochrome c maturation protein CcmE [Candidatus Magnetaquicoccus inordinatus]